MKTFAKVVLKGLLQLLATLLFMAALVLLAIAVFGKEEAGTARMWYAIGGVAGLVFGTLLLVWSNPKDTEGDFLYILLSLIGWPR